MSMTPRQLEEVLTQIAVAESLGAEGKQRAERNADPTQIDDNLALAIQLQSQEYRYPSAPPLRFTPHLPVPRMPRLIDDGQVPVRPAGAAAAAAAPQPHFSSTLKMQYGNAQSRGQNAGHNHRRRGLLSHRDESNSSYSYSTSSQSGIFITNLNTSTPALTKGALEQYIKYVQEGQTGTLDLRSPVAACNNVRVANIADANRLLGHLRDVQSVSVLTPAQEAVQHVMRTAARLEARGR